MKRSARPAMISDVQPSESELFGESVDKFATAAMQFDVTQATHNQRLNGIDTTVQNLQADIRTIRDVQQDQHHYINERVDKIHTDLSGRIDDIDRKLDMQTVTLSKHIDEGMQSLAGRITTVETWRYVIMGGGIVVTFIIGDLLVRVFSGMAIDILK